MSKKASTSLDQIEESIPLTPAFAPAAKSTPEAKAPEVSPSTLPPCGLASPPVQTIPQTSGLAVDEASDESLSDLLYIGLHGHPSPEGWNSSNGNGDTAALGKTTMVETSIALKDGNEHRIRSPATSTSTAAGSTDRDEKRAHEDKGALTKTTKRKTRDEVEPTARKRPVCSTAPRLAVSRAQGAMQPTLEPTPERPTAAKPNALARTLTTANFTPVAESKITAADIVDQILQKTPRASTQKSTSPAATEPEMGERIATQTFISTTSASVTRPAPIAKSAPATKPVPTAKTSSFAKTPVGSKAKTSKPVLNKKFAKSVGVNVSKLKKSNADGEPMPLSATASKLSPAQLAARKAAKRQPAKEAQE